MTCVPLEGVLLGPCATERASEGHALRNSVDGGGRRRRAATRKAKVVCCSKDL